MTSPIAPGSAHASDISAFGNRTLGDLLFPLSAPASSTAGPTLHHPEDDDWKMIDADTFRSRSANLARALLRGGIARGSRVLLLLENDAFFCEADAACLLAGMVSVPVHLNLDDVSLGRIMQHAQPVAAFVVNSTALARLAACAPAETRDMRLIITVAPDAVDNARPARSWETALAAGEDPPPGEDESLPALAAAARPRDPLTLIYTSGTTGAPKGVLLTHENIAFNALAFLDRVPLGPDDRVLNYLPLTHIFARTINYVCLHVGCTVRYTDINRFPAQLTAFRPTFFATVPRFLEKLHAGVSARSTAKAPPSVTLPAALGGHIRQIISGGAALDVELAHRFGDAGVRIVQGYGLTETSPVISCDSPASIRPGTVGRPLSGVEVMIAADGEILTRGPHVMRGYYRDPDATADAIRDGWFHTGDIGKLTDEGHLVIVDRKKNLFKLSTGKYVTPQPVEERLVRHPLIACALVTGDGKPFCTALIFPETAPLLAAARALDLPDDTPSRLLRAPRIIDLVQSLVDDANAGLPPWSRIKRFALLPDPPTTANGQLTTTLKLRRNVVLETHRDAYLGLYASDDDFRERAAATA